LSFKEEEDAVPEKCMSFFPFYDVKVMARGMGKFKLAEASERGVCSMITSCTHIAYINIES
jgi:hypothetical protein